MSEPAPTQLELKIAAERLNAAESALLLASTSEFLSTSTIGDRDRLLLASSVSLAVGVLGLNPPTTIPLANVPLTITNAWALPAGLASILLYFLVSFCVRGWADRNRWRALVGPQSHAWLLIYDDMVREHQRLLDESIAALSKTIDLSKQLQDLMNKKHDIRTARLRYLAEKGAENMTPDEQMEVLRPNRPDTSALDAEIEKLKKGIRTEREMQTLKQEKVRAFPLPMDASVIYAARRSWRVQNAWLIVVPILIGLFSEAIVVFKLYLALRG